MSKARWWGGPGILFLLAEVTLTGHAQTFQTLVTFDAQNGAYPQASLVQGTDGDLYGSTSGSINKSCGFTYGCGTLFKMTPSGVLKTFYVFCSRPNCSDGAYPAGLTVGTDGNFYGTTSGGGANSTCVEGPFVGCGTVFKITLGGVLTTLHSFDGTDGEYPTAAPVEGTDGNFYGTTKAGGNSACTLGCGTVFKMTTSGKLITLHSFDGTDGYWPFASLVQGTDGNFYGTTYGGEDGSFGTIFKITPSGNFTTLHSFGGYPQGAYVYAPLIQASDGNFNGMTEEGGEYNAGTVFKMTPVGKFTPVLSFNGGNGSNPFGSLVQATDGNFYATTNDSGGWACGNVFEMSPGGLLTTLHTFDDDSNNDKDGCAPYGALFQATNGILYGSTYGGGTYYVCPGGCGTIFSENVGLGPFVITMPTAASVGRRVIILGTNLTGTRSVTFNGKAATFTVVSATEITTTVPAGAITGTVQVVTPGGTLKSNVLFRVIQ